MVRTRLKLAATLTVVVLALTGFQTSSGGGHGGGSGKSGSKSGKSKSGGSSSSSSGGGCSSSKKKNDDYDDDDGNGGSGGSGGSTYTPSPTAGPADLKVEVFECVHPAERKRKGKPARKADTTAAIRVTPADGVSGTYRIAVEFERSDGSPVDLGEIVIDVSTPDSRIYDVSMKNPKTVGQVKNCVLRDVTPQSAPASSTPTPTAS